MLRKMIFKAGGRQLTLPVVPESFTVSAGRSIETVNIHELGDVILAGGKKLDSIKIPCLLPAREYPFGGGEDQPYDLITQFIQWINRKTVVRFIVTDTGINKKTLIENISYGEQDGTNDVYAELTLREYRVLEVAEAAESETGNNARAASDEEDAEQSYTTMYGDTLCAICRKFYGDGSYALAALLADYNGRANPNILYVGEMLRIPPRSTLGG